MIEYNTNLKDRQQPAIQEAGKGKIQIPGEIDNIAWQTRGEAPSDYEAALTDALEDIFGSGVESLPEIVAALNDRKVMAPDGTAWTEGSFQLEMKRLGEPFA